MVLSSDHLSPATGLVSGTTLTVTISKDGGTFAAPSGAVTEVGNGWYVLAGNATDRATLGAFIVHATGTACDPSDVRGTIVAFDPFNSLNFGLAALPSAAAGSVGGMPTVDSANGVKVSVGTSAGQINASNGKIPATVASGDGVDAAAIKATIGVAGAGLTGVTLAATGLNAVPGWGSFSLLQTVRAIAQVLFGKRSGVPAAGSAGTITFTQTTTGDYGTISVDTAGNITTSAMTPPV